MNKTVAWLLKVVIDVLDSVMFYKESNSEVKDHLSSTG